jgi:O-antigen/teichoic acid export membrane protein
MLTITQTKLVHRARRVLANATSSLLVPLLSPFVAWLVIRQHGPTLWGEFVALMLLVYLAAHIAGWGNREYLLREFARQPAQITALWQSMLLTRLPLTALFAFAFFFVAATPWQAALLMFWLLALVIDQSFEVLVASHQAFGFAAMVDLLALATICFGVVALGAQLSLDWLITLFALASALSAVALALRFARHTRAFLAPSNPITGNLQSAIQQSAIQSKGTQGHFDIRLLAAAWPFFALGLSGMLQSRVDLYVVALRLPPVDLAHYQIVIGLLAYAQALANTLLLPFLKGFYRLPAASARRVAWWILLCGILGALPLVLLLALFVKAIYGFALPPLMTLAGALYILPAFGYVPLVYQLYRTQRQRAVLLATLGGIALSALASLTLIGPLGIAGALLGAAIAQWGLWFIYWRLVV